MCIYLYAVANVTAIKSSFLLDSFIVDKCLENEHCREHDTTLCDIIILLYNILLHCCCCCCYEKQIIRKKKTTRPLVKL